MTKPRLTAAERRAKAWEATAPEREARAQQEAAAREERRKADELAAAEAKRQADSRRSPRAFHLSASDVITDALVEIDGADYGWSDVLEPTWKALRDSIQNEDEDVEDTPTGRALIAAQEALETRLQLLADLLVKAQGMLDT